MASILLKKLQIMIGHALHKLIAQAYDGAAVLSGVWNGVQALIKDFTLVPTSFIVMRNS